MKNDPIINAKASKIVEAIRKHPCRNCSGYGYTAGHHPSCIGNCDNHGCPHQVQCEDCHATGYYYTEDSITEALASLESHPSEREVLQAYHKWINQNPNASFMSDMKPYDRYLAEKGGEG